MITRILILALLICAPCLQANANMVSTERTETTLISDVKAIHASEPFWVVLHIKMQPGWHTYWKNPGDSGTIPDVQWTLPNGFSAGPLQYLAPDRETIGPLVDYAYDNDAYYLVQVTPPSILRDATMIIMAAKARWLVCKDICIPESGDLSLSLPATTNPAATPSAEAALVGDLVKKLPVALVTPVHFDINGDEMRFDVQGGLLPYDQVKTALFFPATEGLITNAAEQKVEVKPTRISFTIHRAESKEAETGAGLVSLYLQDGTRKDYEIKLQSAPVSGAAGSGAGTLSADTQSYSDVSVSIFFAFFGGIILNLMPCVFPILSLKCLAVAKKAAAHPEVIRKQGIAYTAGVIVSFLVMAMILIAIEKTGQAVGWGFQMQSPLFVATLALLLFAVGLNLSGYFELPVVLGTLGSGAAGQDNLLGSFVTGVLAVLVATPCTAPFMAPAVGFALTQGAVTIFLVFVALGLGLASPFLFISFHPRLIKKLPRPGEWMLTFKQFLAFPIYATVVWLLWILAREVGADGAAMTLVAMLALIFSVWLWQRDSSAARFCALVVIVLGITTAIATVHVPPVDKNTLRAHAEMFSEARLSELRKSGQAILVDATADWCITCKVNEAVALSSPKMLSAFIQHHVTYMVADWTHGDMDITRYLESFGRRGVPIYVYYPPEGGTPVVLPQILTESTVLSTLQ